MNTPLYLLAVLGLLAASIGAQTTASTQVIVPCTQPAPAGSLVAEPSLPITFADAGNEVVIEMESQTPIGDWLAETVSTGFAGDSYFRWNGPNLFGTPGVDTLTYNFEVNATDLYLIRLHVRHDDSDPSEANDCWARVDGGTWEKLFHNTGSSGIGVWTFNARYEDTGDFPQHTLSAGAHTFEISGRSKNFKIDRIHVLPFNVFFAQLSDPQSDVLRARPVIGNPMTVEIDDPSGSFGLTPGVAQTAWYAGQAGVGYPCGASTSFGELLILGAGGPTRIGGFQTWMGPGQPNVHGATIPNNIALVGQTFITQGLMFQAGNFVLSEGLELNMGDI